jgi:hypothetical protein
MGPMQENVWWNKKRKGKNVRGCPTVSRKAVLMKALREYQEKGVHQFTHNASVQAG